MNMSKAFIPFTKESMQKNQTIFEIQNKETLEAMQEAEDILAHPENYNSHENIDDFFKEVDDHAE